MPFPFPDETTKMIQVILPEFVSKRQKGDIFTFGDCDPTAERAIGLLSMNPDKLDKASIQNLATENAAFDSLITSFLKRI